MNGLELSRGYFEEYGLPMLERDFPDALPYLAAGLVGEGSECFGYDDEISRDHDFDPGFCLFLPGEDILDRKTAFALERAYAKLPKNYHGCQRTVLQPVGGNRRGILDISEFYIKKCGRKDGKLETFDWFSLPEYALAEAVNGEVFMDGYGLFTEIRERLTPSAMPDDVKKKKLAGQLLLLGQSGVYNFPRILAHGEPLAAQSALFAFSDAFMKIAFLLSGRYMPYYKWAHRAFRELPDFGKYEEALAFLLTAPNDEKSAPRKTETVDSLSSLLCERVCGFGYASSLEREPEKLAYLVNDSIRSAEIRNLHVLFAT